VVWAVYCLLMAGLSMFLRKIDLLDCVFKVSLGFLGVYYASYRICYPLTLGI
jgi:Na+/H+ antiporter NhaB